MQPPSCLVCGEAYRDASLPGLLACAVCGFVTANVDLTADALRQLYTSKYFSGEEYRDYVAERALFEKHFRLRLKTLQRLVPDSEPSGCWKSAPPTVFSSRWRVNTSRVSKGSTSPPTRSPMP